MPDRIVYQQRCPYCLAEHPPAAVLAVSYGYGICVRCRRTPPVYTDVISYRAALARARIEGNERHDGQ